MSELTSPTMRWLMVACHLSSSTSLLDLVLIEFAVPPQGHQVEGRLESLSRPSSAMLLGVVELDQVLKGRDFVGIAPLALGFL